MKSAAALLVLLLGWRAAAQTAAPSSGPPPDPPGSAIRLAAARFSGLERLPPAAAAEAGVPESWIPQLLELWRKGYGARVALADARLAGRTGTSPAASGSCTAELEVQAGPAGWRTLVRMRTPEGRALETRCTLIGHRSSALLSALAGDLFFLWVQASGFALGPEQPPPPLTGLLSLDSLSLLPEWPSRSMEPLDCAASSDGPILLFADRLLSLDAELNVAPASARDLYLRPPFPQGFQAGRLFLSPLGQPMVYSPSSGQLLIYPPSGAAERLNTDVQEPTHAAGLPRGGMAFLKNGLLFRTLRREGALRKEQLPLPIGFYAAIEGDAEGNYWLLDLAERRVRVFDASGVEIRSLKPAMDPARLPFPQVFAPQADGGFLLGGAGELWRFDAYGAAIWRLSSVFTGVREALPAFFRVACADGFIYLLDAQARRLYRFGRAAQGAEGDGAAELLARFEAGQAGAGELVQGFLERGLILAALPFFHSAFPEASAGETQRLARRVKAQTAQALAAWAEDCERALRVAEAEAAAAEAIRLFRALRSEDPVEAAYARRLQQLAEQRSRLREQLLPGSEGGLEGQLEADRGTGGPVLAIRNSGLQPLGPVGVQARWDGLPGSQSFELMEPIRAGYTVQLPLAAPDSAALAGCEEQLSLSLSVLIRYESEGRSQDRWLRAVFVRSPDGRLQAGDLPKIP